MQEILTALQQWQARGDAIALATVVQAWGSAPRGPGAKMAVTQHGEMAGSVSGGCVEGAVIEEARRALKTGQPRLLHFGVADETAWEVGLACGGTIEIFVEPLPSEILLLHAALAAEQSLVVATLIRGGPQEWLGTKMRLGAEDEPLGALLGHVPRPGQIIADARALLQTGQCATRRYDIICPKGESTGEDGGYPPVFSAHSISNLGQSDKEIEIFFDVNRPAPRLILVGGTHIAADLAYLAVRLGFRIYVVDPRTAFATPARFPDVTALIHQWPDEALAGLHLTADTYVAVLTHDPKLDDPALLTALPSAASYVGALGSRKTHAQRVERLLAAGLAPPQIARIHAPIGLDLGGGSPAEIAVSILAEIVAVRNRGRCRCVSTS
jgi:xanthine dehydrogenase accessory factor